MTPTADEVVDAGNDDGELHVLALTEAGDALHSTQLPRLGMGTFPPSQPDVC